MEFACKSETGSRGAEDEESGSGRDAAVSNVVGIQGWNGSGERSTPFFLSASFSRSRRLRRRWSA